MQRVWRAYLGLLERRPIATKVVTGGILSALADLTAQLLIERNDRVDVKRLSVVSGFGMLGSLILGHYWLGVLEKVFGESMCTAVSLKKTAADVLICGPLEVVAFISWTHFIEQHPGTVREKLREDCGLAVASCLLWTPVSLVAFRYVPYNLRVLYGTMVCYVWDTFLSFAAHNHLGAVLGLRNTDPKL